MWCSSSLLAAHCWPELDVHRAVLQNSSQDEGVSRLSFSASFTVIKYLLSIFLILLQLVFGSLTFCENISLLKIFLLFSQKNHGLFCVVSNYPQWKLCTHHRRMFVIYNNIIYTCWSGSEAAQMHWPWNSWFVSVVVLTACLTDRPLRHLSLLLMSVSPAGLFSEPSAAASSAPLSTRLPSPSKTWWRRWKQRRPRTQTRDRRLKRTTKKTKTKTNEDREWPTKLLARRGTGSR